MRPPVETNSGLSAVLRGVVADLQHASGADIVSIFLYEEATHTYYAPFATGQPQESLLDSLTDMREQLARYLTDADQGKVPDELEAMAVELLARGEWTSYAVGTRPAFEAGSKQPAQQAIGTTS
jgi:hypothetical protein